MWSPDVLSPFSVLAGFRLWMFRVFDGVIAVRNTHVIYIEGEIFALAEMQDAFV
jgi:hypothetical protein